MTRNDVNDETINGTEGESLPLQAINVVLTDNNSGYILQYRTYLSNLGWTEWTNQGENSGDTSGNEQIEAVMFRLVQSNEPVSVSLNKTSLNLYVSSSENLIATITPENVTNKTLTWTTSNSSVATVSAGRVTAKSAGTATITVRTSNGKTASCRVTVSKPSVTYQTHIEDIGWQDLRSNGTTSGTTMQSKRLEAIRINITNNIEGIQYRSHIQDIGWQSWQSNGAISGTSGQSKRMEAIEIKLTGQMANYYDIYYRVHAQEFGWLDWAKNGESAGTAGYSYRLEAIQIVLVEKGGKAPGATTRPFVQHYVSYSTHVQDIGWQEAKYDGEVSGTSGQSKRIEGITIALENPNYSGLIQYRSHVQDLGWQSWQSNGAISGTSGQSKRLEAIEIKLIGQMANYYDIYYRVHAQEFGWLDWAKNGESAGTEGYNYRLEAVEVKLIEKGEETPDDTKESFYKYNSWVANLKASQTSSQLIIVSVFNGSYATVSMHSKDADGYWMDNYSVLGRVGKNGINKLAEGDGKTPTGIFSLHTPFGIKGDPGCPLGYIQVNNNHYWGGGDPEYYNKLVDASTISNYNPAGSEHIIDYGNVYNYCLAVGYNMEQIVGKGSAIFLHCSGKGATGGCISIPEDKMIYTLRNLRQDTKIIIDYDFNISKY